MEVGNDLLFLCKHSRVHTQKALNALWEVKISLRHLYINPCFANRMTERLSIYAVYAVTLQFCWNSTSWDRVKNFCVKLRGKKRPRSQSVSPSVTSSLLSIYFYVSHLFIIIKIWETINTNSKEKRWNKTETDRTVQRTH